MSRRRGKAVKGVVGNLDRFLVILEGNDRQNGPEHFLTRDPHRVGDLAEDRRLDEPALAQLGRDGVPPPSSRGSLAAAHLHVMENLFPLRLGRDRTDLGGPLHWVAEARGLGQGHIFVDTSS